MNGLLEGILDAVEAGGGVALALALLAENLFPPIPSEVILPLAGVAVESGRLPLAVALGAATAGSTLGAGILYSVGRLGGRRVLYRYHWLFRVEPSQLDRADAWFDRHGSWLVLWGRMVPIVRSLVSIPAGFSEMPVVRFLALTALGSTVWNTALITAGMVLGERREQIQAFTGPFEAVILAAMVLVAVLVVVRVLRARPSGEERR